MSIHTKPVGVVRMEFADFLASAEYIFKLLWGGKERNISWPYALIVRAFRNVDVCN
jgi:hypothetical protein